MCLLFDVRLSHLINIKYIHTDIHTYYVTVYPPPQNPKYIIKNMQLSSEEDRAMATNHNKVLKLKAGCIAGFALSTRAHDELVIIPAYVVV